jgi:hypothetical protein
MAEDVRQAWRLTKTMPFRVRLSLQYVHTEGNQSRAI